MTQEPLKENIDALGSDFNEKHEALLQRCSNIETKLASRNEITNTQFNKMESQLAHTQHQMKALQTLNKRPESAFKENKIETKAFGHYMRTGENPAMTLKNLHGGDGGKGGFLAPQQLSEDVSHQLKEKSFFRSLAKITHISTSALDTLIATKDADVGWAADESTRNETETPELRKLRIKAHELYARPRATQSLIDDASISIESWLSEQITEQIAQKETDAFINGDGNGKPRGFLSFATQDIEGLAKIESITTKKAGDFAEAHPEYALFDTVSALKSAYLNEAVWIMSRSAANAVRKLKEPNQMHYVWQAPQGRDTRPFLLGYPVYITDHMPTLEDDNESFSIAFGNFKEAYQIVDRQDIEVLRDPYSYKPYVEFYTTKRVGGDVINTEALKLIHFGA